MIPHSPKSAFLGACQAVCHVSVRKLCISAALLISICVVTGWIYNLFFHPLKNFPGPKIAAVSKIWSAKAWLSGRYPHKIHALHQKYGPVVRTSPNELSFNSAASWKDIYASRGQRQIFLKSKEFYRSGYDDTTNIVREADPIEHGRIRKMFSHAFSAKSLAEQEPVVQSYVDLFIEQIGKHGMGKEGLEIVKWYNYCTFDIIGDLAFGEAFGATKDGKQHFWISLILDSISGSRIIHATKGFPWIKKMLMMMTPKGVMERYKKHVGYGRDKVTRRINSDNKRKDFLTNVLDNFRDQITHEEIASNANVLIIAGSETTATTLSGLTYYLLRNPHTYQLLASEITASFKSYDEITHTNAGRLRYLGAAIDEALRIYPPAATGMMRISPGETVDGYYVPAGTEVCTNPWAAVHDEKNFRDPYAFKPERWLDPECRDVKEASQPFLLGPRVCMGRNLAYMELRLIICKLLFTYHLELLDPVPDWDRDSRVGFLWVKPLLKVRLHERQ